MTQNTMTIEQEIDEALSVMPDGINDVLANFRLCRDLADKVSNLDKMLSQRRDQLEGRLLAYHKDTGLQSLSGAGLTVSFDPAAFRAKYDPAKWSDVVKWAVETGNDFIVQRRLSDAKVVELFDGGVALPDGLSLENYVKVSIRRK